MRLETRPSSESTQLGICATCSRAISAFGRSGRQVLTRCATFRRPIPFPVERCSAYEDKNDKTPSIYTMVESAWILGVDKGNRVIGFCSPKQWRSENKNTPVLPGHFDED